MGSLSDIVDVNKHSNRDYAKIEDIVASDKDYGVGKLFTGFVHSTILGLTGIYSSEAAFGLYDKLNSILPVPSIDLYGSMLPWAGVAAGIAFGLANTNKQKIVPGVATLGVISYSAYQTINTLGIPASYILANAGIFSTVFFSSVAPAAALFGVGYALAALYKFGKGLLARRKKEK